VLTLSGFTVSDAGSFFEVKIGNIITLAGIVLAYFSYLRDQRKQSEERRELREAEIRAQAIMHTENQNKFDSLITFHREQVGINRMRDKQLSEMEQQTAILSEIAKGMDRRLQMLEERRRKEREG
jgi:hypothetical protein